MVEVTQADERAAETIRRGIGGKYDREHQRNALAFARHRTASTAARDALLTQVAITVTQDATGRWYFEVGDPEQLLSDICAAVGHDAIEAARKAYLARWEPAS